MRHSSLNDSLRQLFCLAMISGHTVMSFTPEPTEHPFFQIYTEQVF